MKIFLRKIFNSVINLGTSSSYPEYKRRIQVMNVFLIIMIFTGFSWGITDLIINNRILVGVLELTFSLVGLTFFILHARSQNYKAKLFYFPALSTATLLIINLSYVFSEGMINTNTPWLFLIPSIAFFIGGSTVGIIHFIIIFTWVVCCTILALFDIIYLESTEFALDLIHTISLVTLFSFFYEKSHQRNQKRLEEKNIELERFIYTISHDLRNPLTSIRGYIDEIRSSFDKKDYDQVSSDLKKVDSLAENMGKMIDDLLYLSRSNKKDFPLEEVDINQLITQVIKRFQPEIEKFNFKIKIAENLPVIKAHKQAIEEIYSNLIGNALKFTKNTLNPQISLGFEKKEEEYHFFVRDNGEGIETKDLSKIFQLFYTKDTNSGTGLGLNIVENYVKRHQGRVWVESQKRQGSTFWFSIPHHLGN